MNAYLSRCTRKVLEARSGKSSTGGTLPVPALSYGMANSLNPSVSSRVCGKVVSSPPFLYCLFVDELLDIQSGLGVSVRDIYVGSPMYADYLAL